MGKVYAKTNYNPKSALNLRPVTETATPEQLAAARSKGGRNAAQNRRKNVLFRDIIAEIGSQKLSKRKMSDNIKALADMCGIEGDISNDVVVILAQYAKAAEGDTDAARFLRDTSGQKPAENVQIGPIDAQSADLTQYTDEQLEARRLELLSASSGDYGGDDGDFDGGE